MIRDVAGEQEANMVCPRCGKEVGEGAVQCEACGQPVGPAPHGQAGPPRRSGLAVASLVLGIVGPLGLGLPSLIGVVLGALAIGQVGRSGGRLRGQGLAIAGVCVSAVTLLLSVVVVSVGLMYCRVERMGGQARRARAVQDIATIKTALGVYAIHNGQEPTEAQGLRALLVKPTTAPQPLNWQGPYLRKPPRDPWGHDYVYRVTAEGEYHVFSYGRDGQAGGAGEDADVTEDTDP